MKKTLGAVLGLLVVANAHAVPTFYWYSPSAVLISGQDIKGPTDVYIPQSSTWAVQLIRQSDSQVLLSSDPLCWGAMERDGVFYRDPVAADAGWNSVAVYTVFYNNANPALASMWTVPVSPVTLSWSDIPTPASELHYQVGPVTQSMWVPEPGTGLLVLAGAAVAIFRRRRAEA